MKRLHPITIILALHALAAFVGCGSGGIAPPPSAPAPKSIVHAELNAIEHIVVIYLENHSFDNLYGEFAGAENLAAARAEAVPAQVDANGVPYGTLPQPINTASRPPQPDRRFPAELPNAPFAIEDYVAAGQAIPDLVHRFYQEQIQIDGGRMDRFVAVSDAAGLSMGYYHTANLPLAALARSFTLCDHFFHGAFGGSFLNHIFLVSAAAPTFADAPGSMKAVLDSRGALQRDGKVTPDGFAVNTMYSVNTPHPADARLEELLPDQTMPTIGDRLTEKGVTWAWYAGGWDDALAGRPSPFFQFHHQPFVYFSRYADGTRAKTEHLKDEADLTAAIAAGTLPAVSFFKPLGDDNEHPGYAELDAGERHTAGVIAALMASPVWSTTAIIVTYDENGGFWDHVRPPQRDRFGPGARVPTLVISPHAKRGHVEHTSYDTAAILKLIEQRFDLEPLGTADAQAADLGAVFDFRATNSTP